MKCNKCGHSANPAGAAFCEECGNSLTVLNPPVMVNEPKKNYLPYLLGILGLVSLILGIAYFTEDSSPISPEASTSSNATPLVASPVTKPVSAAISTFNYKAPVPIGGKKKGVIELGAEGFNSFIIDLDNDKNWKLVKADWGNKSMITEGLASQEDILRGLKSFISEIVNNGVESRDIHFVVSSGALQEEITKKIVNGLKKLRYVANEVTKEQEGEYALKAVIPESFRDKAFALDIGSGNTKISWFTGSKVETKGIHGSKYFQKKISDSQVNRNAKKVGAMIPKANAKTCFAIGGVPFTMAKKSRKNKERYTILTDASNYEAKDEKMKCGLNIYNSIRESSNCEQVIFDWDANFTIGFLLDLPY